MWLFFQIVAYLVVALAIGAAGAWILRGRMAEDSLEHLRQRFRQMVSSSEMERDAARLRVRELAHRVEELEARLEGRPADGSSAPEATDSGASVSTKDTASDPAEAPFGDPTIAAPSDYGSVHLDADGDEGAGGSGPWSGSWGRHGGESEPAPAAVDTLDAPGKAPRPSPTGEAAAEGGHHPLSHLGEVPPEVSNTLRSRGIHDTTALYRQFQNGYDPAAMARELDIEPRRVRRWRILAELLEVPGMVPENAWLLEISGVASLSELAAEDPGELADRMAGLNRDQGLGLPSPTQDEVASWVLWASQAGAVQV